MAALDFKDIIYFKDSELLLQKIKEIETMLHEMNCVTIFPSKIYIENDEMSFDLRVSFPLPYFLSVGNLNTEPGENLPPVK
jgi:hypothetical protein